MYIHCKPENVQSAVTSVQQCVTAIEQWMAASRLRLNMEKTELVYGQVLSTTCRRSRAPVVPWHLVVLTLPNQMTSVFSESNSRRICHSTSTSTLLVLSASFNYDNNAASDVLWMTTLSLHSFMRSSRAESIMTGAPKKTTDKLQRVLKFTRQHESSRTRASSTEDSLIFGEVSYTGWTLSTGFGSEFASRCSDVCTRWLLNTCLPTAIPSPASLAVDMSCDQLTVVILTFHVWNLLRTEDVHLHTPALRIGTHFLLTLDTVVFVFHLLSATSKPFSSLSNTLAHAARLGFFYKNALFKFTVIIIIIILPVSGNLCGVHILS